MAWSALLVFLTVGFFKPSQPGWNVNSQLDMTYALVERGTLRIDAYHSRNGPELYTEDKAFIPSPSGGHYYTDKSPVTPLLAVPGFAIYKVLTPASAFNYAAARYWTTWLTIGLCAALLAALMTLLFIKSGVSPGAAAAASALWIGATPLLGYSTLFFNYTPACLFTLGGFMLARRAWAGPTPTGRSMLFAGILIGLAVWTLNTVAIVALVLTFVLLIAPVQPGQAAVRGRFNRLLPWVIGGIIGAIGHFIYVRAVFGTFGSPYAFEADPHFKEAMSRGLMGAGWPRPIVMWAITFSHFQGLFFWWPLALVALVGCVWALARGARAERFDAIAALGFTALLIVYTSGYFMWWGGRAYAPRHLIPCLALLAVGLIPFLRMRRSRNIVLAIGVIGALINLGPVALDAQPWVGLDEVALSNPETVTQWPSAMWALEKMVWVRGWGDHNWGTALVPKGALDYRLSFLPLIAIWLVFWLVNIFGLRHRPDTSQLSNVEHSASK